MSYFLLMNVGGGYHVEEHETKQQMEDAVETKVKARAMLPEFMIKGKRVDYSYLVNVKLNGEP